MSEYLFGRFRYPWSNDKMQDIDHLPAAMAPVLNTKQSALVSPDRKDSSHKLLIKEAVVTRQRAWEEDYHRASQLVNGVAQAIEALKNNELVRKWESESLAEVDSRLKNLNHLLAQNDFAKLDEASRKTVDYIKKIAERATESEKMDKERFQAVKCTKVALERLGVPFQIITDKNKGNKGDVIIAIGFGREKQLDIEMGLNGSVKMVPQGAGYGDHSCRGDMRKLFDILREDFGILVEINTDPESSSNSINSAMNSHQAY